MEFKKKIYYISEQSFEKDLSLQYGDEVIDEIFNTFNDDHNVYYEGFYCLPLDVDYSDKDPIYSLVANYYKDVAPWADILVVDSNDVYFFIDY